MASIKIAFFLQSETKADITPYLVYLLYLFKALIKPFYLSHLIASEWFPWVYSRAFLHYPIGALVYYLSFFKASNGTLKVENNLFDKNLFNNISIIFYNKKIKYLIIKFKK